MRSHAARSLPQPSSRLWILDLEILAIANRLIVSAQEREGNAGRPVAIMEELAFPVEAVTGLSREIQRCLSYQREPSATRTRLEQLGLQLFDLMLGPRIKALVRASRASHLILRLQSSLLDIPWELLHTGDEFFCLKFCMGRTVKLEAVPSASSERPVSRPYRMLILCDPRGDLPHAAEEGLGLLRALVPREEELSVDLLAAPIARQQVIEELRRYDFVHYAGHAVASSEGGPAGWLLDDAPFSADDIVRMQGSRAFPLLIFANACLSGTATGFGAEAMPRAWLDAGVRHYIGAVSDLPDMTGERSAARFYPALLAGQSVGEALREARGAIAADRTLPSLAWAGYLLYGDPTDCYFEAEEKAGVGTEAGQATLPLGPRGVVKPPAAEAPPRATSGGGAGETEPALEAWKEPSLPPGRRKAGTKAEGSRPDSGSPVALAPPRVTPAVWPDEVGFVEPEAETEGELARPSILRLLLGGLAGLVLGVMSAAGMLEALDLVWESGRYLGHRQDAWFGTQITLLSIKPGRLEGARGVYAELLEQLNARGVRPKLVAIDTWITADRRTPHDERLMQAIAASVDRFPVIIGLDNDPATGAVKPPPRWFEHGLKEAMAARARAACGEAAGKAGPALKGCVDSLTQTYETHRMLWANLWIQQPYWFFEHFGLRVPLVLRTRGQAGLEDAQEGLAYQRPHFAVLLAQPDPGGLDPSSGRVRSLDDPVLASYDHRGLMPVVFTGKASWEGKASFPAYDLEALLERWRSGGAPSGGPGSAGLEPGALTNVRLLVGVAGANMKENETDQYDTPIGRMFGVEVLANVAESLVQRKVPLNGPPWASILVGGLAGAGGAWLGLRRRAGAWLLAVAAGLLAVSYLLLTVGNLSLSPVAALLALAVGAWLVRGRARANVAVWMLAVALVCPGTLLAQAQPQKAQSGQAQPPGRKSTAQVAPRPPSVPARPKEVAGWRLIDVRPRDVAARQGLRLEAGGGAPSEGNGSLEPGAGLSSGSVLRSTEAGAEVLLEFRDPTRGVVLRHGLWGEFTATLEADGSVGIEAGSIWTRLFRYLENAGGPFYMKYDGMPAGFGSTEVAYRGNGKGGRTLFVLEGRVTYQRGKDELVLQAGEQAKWSKKPGKPQPASEEERRTWIELGSKVELATLPADRVCASSMPAFAEASILTGACFPDPGTRDGQLRSARLALAGKAGAVDWRKMGEAYLASGELGRAADSFRRGIADGGEPKEVARMHLELGNIRWAMGDAAAAKRAYGVAVALDPGQAPAWNNLGILQWRDGEVDQAKDSLQKATEIDPKLFQGWRNLGRVWFAQKPGEALKAWEQAAALSSADPSLWKDLGLTYAMEGRVDRALEAVKRSTTLDPAQAELWYQLGQWYWAQGRKAEAIDAYDRAQEIEMRTK